MSSWNTEAAIDAIGDFLDDVLDAAGLELEFEISEGEVGTELISPDILVNFEGDDLELLLANRGELLLALEQLTLEAIKTPHDQRYRVLFDADDYRLSRIEELQATAKVAAEKVRETGQPFHFQPMTSRERRILHLALRDEPGVTSLSEGMAPRRHTVVTPS